MFIQNTLYGQEYVDADNDPHIWVFPKLYPQGWSHDVYVCSSINISHH